MAITNLPSREILDFLFEGTVIPAHPLALLPGQKKIDEDGQRKLTRYYIDSGAGGVAVGVHTTQFEIRNQEFQLLEPVLKIVSQEIDRAALVKPFIKVAGVCGTLVQARVEAHLAVKYGYHFGLLSMGGLPGLSEAELIERAKAVAEIIPVFGFYLQPAVGGRILSYEFWKAFSEIENVHAIKVAAFNRYQTIDVVKAVASSSRSNSIALYTGNDDNIVADLLTPYKFMVNGNPVTKQFIGGLLGHWAFCTEHAVETLQQVKQCIHNKYAGVENLLSKGIDITDTNAAVFDTDNNFHGCISGVHEMLLRQGVMSNTECLLDKEQLSPGQPEKINDICRAYFPALAK